MSIRPEDWPRVRDVFEGALAVPAPERREYVARACGTDGALLVAVEQLLASHNRAGVFLETPAVSPITEISDLTRSVSLEGTCMGPYQLGARIGAGGMDI